jgi:YggT family protein
MGLLIQLVDGSFQLMSWLIIGRCILSFVRHNPNQPLIKFVYDATELILSPIRRLMPSSSGVDFSPLLALLVIMLVRSLTFKILAAVAYM